MDTYFRSVGFTRVRTQNQMKLLGEYIFQNPDWRYIQSKNCSNVSLDYYKEYADNMGISIKGVIDNNEKVDIQKVNPFFFTSNIVEVEDLNIESHRGEYFVTCYHEKTGNDIAFYLHNALDYKENHIKKPSTKVNIVGLSVYGKIILPVYRDPENEPYRQKEEDYYRSLVKGSRSGDESYTRKLNEYERKTNEAIKERLLSEDFLTVVEGFFLSSYEEYPNYYVLGDIMSVETIHNVETDEDLYLFMLDILGVNLEVCINAKDLMGIPSVGMRFMGQCWLQGKVLY